MEKQVRVGQASIPFSSYLAMIRFPETQQGSVSHTTTKLANDPTESMEELLANFPEVPLILKYDGVPPEDAVLREDTGSRGISIVDIVEIQLAEKARASLKRHETFAPSDHQWRRNINSAYRGPKHMWASGWALPWTMSKSTYLFHTSSKELNQTEPQIEEAKFWGTNQILEYFSFVSDAQKNEVLRNTGDGDYHIGADIVRAAFQIAKFYGLIDNYHGVIQEKCRIFNAIINSINNGNTKPKDLQKSVQLTDLVIEALGLEQMPAIIEHYDPFLKIKSLVPKEDIYNISSVMKMPEFRHLKGRELMQELGYKPVEANNIPVLWYRPPAKPI